MQAESSRKNISSKRLILNGLLQNYVVIVPHEPEAGFSVSSKRNCKVRKA